MHEAMPSHLVYGLQYFRIDWCEDWVLLCELCVKVQRVLLVFLQHNIIESSSSQDARS
jgi:hypothetical protein